MALRGRLWAILLASAAAATAPASAAAHPHHPAHPHQPAQPAQHRSGSISNEDYPASALRERAEGASVLRFLVGTDGRVLRCEVVRSSGNFALDATACSLIQRRFRYVPARDATGATVEQWITRQHRWILPEAARSVPGPKPASD